MEIIIHDPRIAEFVSNKNILNNTQDMLDLMVMAYEKDANKIILHENNINPDFFELKTGFAGEALQKAVNYHIKLAITGDFNKYASKSLMSFIIESNGGDQFFFVSNTFEAVERLKKYK
jgi:hypothetical protein